MKKKSKHHHRKRKPPQYLHTPPENQLLRGVATINTMKPIMAAAQRTAARQRERKRDSETE